MAPSHTDTVLGIKAAEAPLRHPEGMSFSGKGSPAGRTWAYQETALGAGEAGLGPTAQCWQVGTGSPFPALFLPT